MVNTRRGSGSRGNDQHPPPPSLVFDLAQMMAMQNQMMQTMAQMVANMQQMAQANHVAPPLPPPRQDDALRRFMMTQPPIFKHAVEPMDAEDWLQIIESKLEIAYCEGRDRVLYAAHQLQGKAKNWWNAYTAAHEDPQTITWQEFRRIFRAHYVPSGEIKVKHKEFLALKQGSMSVREYLTKFTQLSRYAFRDVDDDDKKQDCFREGLNHGIRYALSSNDYPSFQRLVDKAFTIERERQSLEVDRKRKMSFQSQASGSNTRTRFNAPGQAVRQGGHYHQQRQKHFNQGSSQYKQQMQPQQQGQNYQAPRQVVQPQLQNHPTQVTSKIGPCFK